MSRLHIYLYSEICQNVIYGSLIIHYLYIIVDIKYVLNILQKKFIYKILNIFICLYWIYLIFKGNQKNIRICLGFMWLLHMPDTKWFWNPHNFGFEIFKILDMRAVSWIYSEIKAKISYRSLIIYKYFYYI